MMNTATKSCRKHYEPEKEEEFSLLPDDVILDIFQKLSPNLLRYKVRFVCQRWFNIITNKILLNHASLILETHEGRRGCQQVRLMDIREENEGLKMKDQYLYIPYTGNIKTWCNEFLLMKDLNKTGGMYIFNLINKEGARLPSCTIQCGGHSACKCGLGLCYDEFKDVYKVVHVVMGPPIQCEILVLNTRIVLFRTLKWKKIDGPSYSGQRNYYFDDPVSVRGRYFHWDVHSYKYLLSMDTVKEQFRQTILPGLDIFTPNNRYSFVEMGGFLTLLSKVSSETINVWMLKDFQKTKWEMLHSIAVTSSVRSSIYPGSSLPVPITTVKSKRYIIFKKPGSDSGLYSYDLKDKVMKRLDIVTEPTERCVVLTSTAGFF